MKQQRKGFFRTNPYQNQIIILAFFPVLAVFCLISVLITMMHNDMAGIILYDSPALTSKFISNWSNLISSGLSMALIVILMWAYVVSSRLVGAMERILRELDNVIDSGEKKVIKARAKDNLANDILERINVIVQRLP